MRCAVVLCTYNRRDVGAHAEHAPLDVFVQPPIDGVDTHGVLFGFGREVGYRAYDGQLVGTTDGLDYFLEGNRRVAVRKATGIGFTWFELPVNGVVAQVPVCVLGRARRG